MEFGGLAGEDFVATRQSRVSGNDAVIGSRHCGHRSSIVLVRRKAVLASQRQRRDAVIDMPSVIQIIIVIIMIMEGYELRRDGSFAPCGHDKITFTTSSIAGSGNGGTKGTVDAASGAVAVGEMHHFCLINYGVCECVGYLKAV